MRYIASIILFVLLNIFSEGYAFNVVITSKEVHVPVKISLYRDSIFLTSLSSRDSIINLPDKEFDRIKIDAKGFISIDTLYASKTQTLHVKLERLPIKLNEVVVYADATMKEDGINSIITNLSNSYFAELGNLNNALEWIPGLMKLESGKIIIPDYGEPLIYVDGRRLSSQSELNAIPTNEVAKIKILREPGSSYPPGTNCVIDIKLRKHLSDYISINPTFRYTQRSLPGANAGLGILFSTQKITGSVFASYNHSGSKPKTEQFTHFDSDDLMDYSQNKNTKSLSNTINLSGGLAYNFNSESRIQFQYEGNMAHSNRNTIEKIRFNNDNTESTFQRTSHNSNNIHNVSVGYYMESDATSISVSVAYNAIQRSGNTKYTNSESTLDVITSPTRYDSFLSYCEFSHETSFGTLTGGYNIAISNSRNDYTQNSITTNSHYRAYAFTPYLGYERRIHNFTFQGTISYAYDKMRHYTPSLFSKTYNVITPSLLVKYKINGRSISLNYKAFPEFPSYYELNPIKEQIDSLNYYQGNPELQYFRLHSLDLNAGTFSGISTGISYSWRNNTITEMLIINPTNSILGVYTPMNVGRYQRLRFNISYNLWRKNFNIFANSSLDYTQTSYPIGVSQPSSRSLSVSLMLNGRYTFAGKYNIFTNSWYRSPYIITNQKIGHTLGVNIGVSMSLLNKSLNLSLTASDLFNRAVSPSSVVSQYSNFNRNSKFNYDGRALTFTISYTLNPLKKKYEKTDDYEDFINRAASRD